MKNIQKRAYTSKEILTIAYPILISLVMEPSNRYDRYSFFRPCR